MNVISESPYISLLGVPAGEILEHLNREHSRQSTQWNHLKDADLSGVNLTSLILPPGICFRNSNFTQATLMNNMAYDVLFVDCIFDLALFYNGNWQNCTFSSCKLDRTCFFNNRACQWKFNFKNSDLRTVLSNTPIIGDKHLHSVQADLIFPGFRFSNSTRVTEGGFPYV